MTSFFVFALFCQLKKHTLEQYVFQILLVNPIADQDPFIQGDTQLEL